MWVSSSFADWFEISRDTVSSLREELAATKAERNVLQQQLNILQVNFDWVRMQINSLQLERAVLLDKAYGIKIPTPELSKAPVMGQDTQQDEFSFEDIGDDLARKLQLPIYGPFGTPNN